MKRVLYVVAFFIIALAPFLGEISLDFKDIFDSNSTSYMVFWDLRVPRVIVAFFVGGVLALSGLIFQIIFKNALITPYTLGIASGTTLFTAIAIVFFPAISLAIPGAIGSFLTILILYYISKRLKESEIAVSTNSILLIGIALSYFYSSALMLVFYLSNLEENYSIVRFTLGSLDVVGFDTTVILFFISLALLLFVKRYQSEIRLLLVSNDMAFLKGVDVNRVNVTLLVVVSFCVGISISFVGPIGFVGLVIPHIIKIIYKKSADRLFFQVFFYGGVFLVFSDLIARNLGTNSTLPIGVVTAFIGAPFFVYLLLVRTKQKKR